MRNLFEFFVRYGVFLVFLILELICLNLVIRNNQRQAELYHRTSSRITAAMQKQVSAMTSFLGLRDVNDSLMVENARLRQQLINRVETVSRSGAVIDSTISKYNVIPALVVQNSIGSRNNYITIDKGSTSGVMRGMGVVSAQGPVGVVVAATPHYSKIMSVLHSNTMISASVKSKGYFGSLVWRSSDPRIMQLDAIPKHARLQVGDKIVTSGYSNVFPPLLQVGQVDTFWLPRGSNFYRSTVKLDVDMSKLHSVYVVQNLSLAERDSLETTIIDE